MSVLGMIDALRTDMAASSRLVWICLENHSNGARWWATTVEKIAAELFLSADTVGRGIDELVDRGVIRIERRKRRPTVFHMIRVYPKGGNGHFTPQIAESTGLPEWMLSPQSAESNGNEPAELSPQIAGSSELSPQIAESTEGAITPTFAESSAELSPQSAESSAELSPQIAESLNPPVRIHKEESTKKEEKGAHARATSAASVEQRIVDAWNEMATSSGLPSVRAVTGQRRRNLFGRLAEHGEDGVLAAVAAIGRSSFCRGQNDRAWVAGFDFLVQSKSCAKAIEGSYADRTVPVLAGVAKAFDPSKLSGAPLAMWRIQQEREALHAAERGGQERLQ